MGHAACQPRQQACGEDARREHVWAVRALVGANGRGFLSEASGHCRAPRVKGSLTQQKI